MPRGRGYGRRRFGRSRRVLRGARRGRRRFGRRMRVRRIVKRIGYRM